MKINRRTAKILFPPTVALCMSGMMSFVLTLVNQEFDANFVAEWVKGFAVGFVVGVPISVFLIPRIQKFYEGITEKSAEVEETE